jgi:F-type H+-transporting ATPase subunit delta
MSRNARTWAEALLGFASTQEIEEKRAAALESAAIACFDSSNMEAASVARYLNDPSVTGENKTEALAAMVPEDKTWGAFCESMVRAHANRLLPRIAKEYRSALDRKSGIERVVIESPRPLDAFARSEVLNAWKSIRNTREISVTEVIVPELLGGFRFRSGSIRYDASIAGKLRELKTFLGQPLKRAAAADEGQ